MASRSGRVMEHPANQEQQRQQQWAVLKCPRCDSTNTKFCYYNNYSLSQPRHFCKACKRYWTRGGTLRNVPIGGGCRKNKRVNKRPSLPNIVDGGAGASSSSTPPSTSSVVGVTTSTDPLPAAQPKIMDLSSSTLNHMNIALFYGLPTNPCEMNNIQFPPPRFNSRSVSSTVDNDTLDRLNGFGGLAFSSGLIMSGDNYNRNGFDSTTKQIQDTTWQRGSWECHKSEVEGGQNRLHDWNVPCQINNQIDPTSLLSSDPAPYWDSATANANAWHDPANVGRFQSLL